MWTILTKKFSGIDGRVSGLSCVKVDFSAQDANGRPVMEEISGSEFTIDADLVVLALGFLYPQKEGLLSGLGVELDGRGNVKTDADYMTARKGVFAAGDMRRGQSLIVWAISEGRKVARAIDTYLMGKSYLPVM